MAKMSFLVNVIVLKDSVCTLDELAKEIAKKLYEASRTGEFKVHEKAIVTDMIGIKANA